MNSLMKAKELKFLSVCMANLGRSLSSTAKRQS